MPYNDPDRTKDIARMMVHKALKKGTLIRPDACENCFWQCTPQGHHNDYSKPLDVNWLCAVCHAEVHHEHGGKYEKFDFEKATSVAKELIDHSPSPL